MTLAGDRRRRMRERSEHYLRLAAMEDLRRRYPEGTTAPFHERGGAFWRSVFVPVYRRLPWEVKQRAMRAARMTASGWTPPPRMPGEPWTPPTPGAPPDGGDAAGS
jgi:hypothetical protein